MSTWKIDGETRQDEEEQVEEEEEKTRRKDAYIVYLFLYTNLACMYLYPPPICLSIHSCVLHLKKTMYIKKFESHGNEL